MKLGRKNNRKKFIIATVVGLILLGGAAAFAYQYGLIPGVNQESKVVDGINYDEATDQQKEAGMNAKKEFIDKDAKSNQDPSENTDNPTQTKTVDITITNHGISNGVYQFRTMISTVETDGSCTLRLTSDGKQDISKVTKVQVLGLYAVCAGYFDIPISQLAGSTWKASISYESGQSTGKTTTTVKVE